jgi:flagellar FliJ protein
VARFVFKLEGVLRPRENVERQRMRDLALVQAKMTALEGQLRALDAEVKESNESMRRNYLVGRIDLDLLAAHRRYLGATQRRAMEIAQEMAGVQKSMDEARAVLAAAARERKVLEKVREKRQAAWQAEINHREAAALDEIGMQMSHRNERGR